MRITQFFGDSSKNAQAMRYDHEHAHGDIYDRYERPSGAKVSSWYTILETYESNNGIHAIFIKGIPYYFEYLGDLRVAGASSHFYSTIATFKRLDTAELYLIKETHANTYMCKL